MKKSFRTIISFADGFKLFKRKPEVKPNPYTCHMVSRETYEGHQIGDEYQGKEIVEGFVNAMHHVLVVTEGASHDFEFNTVSISSGRTPLL